MVLVAGWVLEKCIKVSGQGFHRLQALLWAVPVSSRRGHQRRLETRLQGRAPDLRAGALCPLCCAQACAFGALILIHVAQTHGAAPPTGGVETVHVGRKGSGRWERLRSAWRPEKTLE